MSIGMLRRHYAAEAEARAKADRPTALSKMRKADLVAEAEELEIDPEGMNVKALRKAVGEARKG